MAAVPGSPATPMSATGSAGVGDQLVGGTSPRHVGSSSALVSVPHRDSTLNSSVVASQCGSMLSAANSLACVEGTMSHVIDEPEKPTWASTARHRCYDWGLRLAGLLVRRPACVVFVVQLIIAVLCIIVCRWGVVDVDIAGLAYNGTNASFYERGYQHAWLESRHAPANEDALQNNACGLTEGVPHDDLFQSDNDEPCYSNTSGVTYVHFYVSFIYHQENGDNILTEKRLYAIQQYENRLRGMSRWGELCRDSSGAARTSCDPGETLINFVWPELSNPRGEYGLAGDLRFTGRSSRWLPLEMALGAFLAGGERVDRVRRFLPRDFVVPDGGRAPRADTLRSHFLFSLPVGSGTGAQFETAAEAKKAFDELVSDELHPAAADGSELLEEEGVRVYAQSKDLERYELFRTLQLDWLAALGGPIVAFILMRLRTGSTLSALFGLFLVIEAIPLGYVFFWIFTGGADLSLLNGLSLFLVLGICSDLVFAEVINSWHASANLPELSSQDYDYSGDGAASASQAEFASANHTMHMRIRLGWLWGNCFMTSTVMTMCVSSSFLFALTSALMSFRNVGLFMTLCILSSSLLMMSVFPLSLVCIENWHHRHLDEVRHPMSDGGKREAPCESNPVCSRVLQLTADVWRAHIARLAAWKAWVCGAFVVFALVFFICAVVLADPDSSPPSLFVQTHDQTVGKTLQDRFGETVPIAASPASQEGVACTVASPNATLWASCMDHDRRCGAWAAIGRCEQSAAFMQRKCARSCGCKSCWIKRCPVADPPPASQGTRGQCQCYQAGPTFYGDRRLHFRATFVGLPEAMWENVRDHVAPLFDSMYRPPSNSQAQTKGFLTDSPLTQPPLAQQHWRSGQMALWPTFDAPIYSVVTHDAGSNADSVQDEPQEAITICYCDGIAPCTDTINERGVIDYLPGDNGSDARRIQSRPVLEGRGLDGAGGAGSLEAAGRPRRLVELSLAHASRDVNVIWGLRVRDPSPFFLFAQNHPWRAWSFDSSFDPGDPWAQRSMMAMCSGLPTALRVRDDGETGGSWIQAFETWLLARGEQYPSRDFHLHIQEFTREQGRYRDSFMMEGGRARAIRIGFTLRVPDSPGLREALDLREAWDRHVEDMNRRASVRARRAWHTSHLWVLVDSHQEVVASFWWAMCLSVLAGLGLTFFLTRSLKLMLITFASVLSVLLALVFFATVMLSWTIGVAEALALTCLVGYIFSVNLHVSYAYSCALLSKNMRPDYDPMVDRHHCTQHAFDATVWRVLGSIAAMLGCCFLLFFCTLRFHVKFGTVVCAMVIMLFANSLVLLPALLLCFGPTSRDEWMCQKHWNALVARLRPSPLVQPVKVAVAEGRNEGMLELENGSNPNPEGGYDIVPVPYGQHSQYDPGAGGGRAIADADNIDEVSV